MKNEKDLLRQTLVNLKSSNVNSKDIVRVWEGFFRFLHSKTAMQKQVVVPELGTFHNKLFDMTSVEKQLQQPQSTQSPTHIQFYPNSALTSKGKFTIYPKMDRVRFRDDMMSRSTTTGFTKYTFSFNGSSNPEKFVIKLDYVSKLTDMDPQMIKFIFRTIIGNMLHLKDHQDLCIDIKIGTLFMAKENMEQKPFDFQNKNTNIDYRLSQGAENIFSPSVTSDETQQEMSAPDRLIQSDQQRRINFIKSRQQSAEPPSPKAKPQFIGAQSGHEYNRVQGIKVNTELPHGKEQYKAILDQQRFEKQRRQLLDFESGKQKDENMLMNDHNTLHKSIMDFQDKKSITKEELNLHNSILRQTKRLKDQEEQTQRKQPGPQYFPFVNGDLQQADRALTDQAVWAATRRMPKPPTPRAKKDLWNNWPTMTPVYERKPTPEHKRRTRGHSFNKDQVQRRAYTELENKKDQLNQENQRKELEIQHDFNYSILNDMELRHKKKILNITNQDFVKDQISTKNQRKLQELDKDNIQNSDEQ